MPETANLRKACLQGWPLAGIWETCSLGMFPQFPVKSGSLYLNFLCKQYVLYWTYLPSESLEFLYMLDRRCLCNQPPIEILGIKSLMNFLADNISHVLAQFSTRKIKCILCDSARTVLLEACAWFPPDIPPRAFSLYRFYFISSTTVIHSHEDISSICSPMNRLSESPNL